MRDRYLFINPSSSVFPCDKAELKYALDNGQDILETWPGHEHGPEFRVTDKGCIVLDLLNPEQPMTIKDLKELEVL